MSPVSLVLCTVVTWVDLKDRIGKRPPVYCMGCPCFIIINYYLKYSVALNEWMNEVYYKIETHCFDSLAIRQWSKVVQGP